MERKYADINSALLRFISYCHSEGDYETLNNIGIDHEALALIQSMTVQEALHTTKVKTSFIKSLTIDSPLLKSLLLRARNQVNSNRYIDELIDYGAPIELIQQLTGISPKEFAERRKMKNIQTRGRTQMPSEEQEAAIIEAWKDYQFRTDLSGEEWIALAKSTHLPIRLIYKIVFEQGTSNEQIH